jgi:hypothetical protein
MPFFTANQIPGATSSPLVPKWVRDLIRWPNSRIMPPPQVYTLPIGYLVDMTVGVCRTQNALLITDWSPTAVSTDVAARFSIAGTGWHSFRVYDRRDHVIHTARLWVVVDSSLPTNTFLMSWTELGSEFHFHLVHGGNLVLEAMNRQKCQYLPRPPMVMGVGGVP